MVVRNRLQAYARAGLLALSASLFLVACAPDAVTQPAPGALEKPRKEKRRRPRRSAKAENSLRASSALTETKKRHAALAARVGKARGRAAGAGAARYAAADLADAEDLHKESARLAEASEFEAAMMSAREALDLFEYAEDLATKRTRLDRRALALHEEVKKYKQAALALDAPERTLTEWVRITDLERRASSARAGGELELAANTFEEARAVLVQTIEILRQIAADGARVATAESTPENSRNAGSRAPPPESESESPSESPAPPQRLEATPVAAAVPTGALAALALELEADLHGELLSPHEESFLRAHYHKLSRSMQYDPDTGVVLLDYTDSDNVLEDCPKQVKRLRANKHLELPPPSVATPGVAGPEAAGREAAGRGNGLKPFSFAVNTGGTLLFPVPLRGHVRVDWDMAIQTMDRDGAFGCVVAHDSETKSYFLSDWLDWGAVRRGGRRRWIKRMRGLPQSANRWFDKTRDVSMRVEFEEAPPEPKSRRRAVRLTARYDVGPDERANEFLSRKPVSLGGRFGFRWYRVKCQLKRLRIAGLLDKPAAIKLLLEHLGLDAVPKPNAPADGDRPMRGNLP